MKEADRTCTFAHEPVKDGYAPVPRWLLRRHP
jgi:hypothetical protein